MRGGRVRGEKHELGVLELRVISSGGGGEGGGEGQQLIFLRIFYLLLLLLLPVSSSSEIQAGVQGMIMMMISDDHDDQEKTHDMLRDDHNDTTVPHQRPRRLHIPHGRELSCARPLLVASRARLFTCCGVLTTRALHRVREACCRLQRSVTISRTDVRSFV